MPSVRYKVRKSVSQHLLRRYVELQQAVQEFEDVKAQILECLKDGLPCQPGPLKAHLSVRTGSRRPKWKSHYELLAIEVHGMDDARRMIDNIIESTEPCADSYSVKVV